MKILVSLALVAAFAGPALCGDMVVTKEKHSDPMMGQPAKDTVEVTWFGKDRMRVDEGNSITIVRLDQKKMYTIDSAAKTYTAFDLPVDLKKLIPAEMAPFLERMGQAKATVTPTTETKKIKDWDATRYTMTMSMGMGTMTQEMWVVKSLGADHPGWRDMYAAMLSANLFASGMADEMKKIEGMAVLVERTNSTPGGDVKSREAITKVEDKDPAAGFYDLPTGLTEKPFDPMAGMGGGPPRRQR